MMAKLTTGKKLAIALVPALLAAGLVGVGAKPAARWLAIREAQRAGIRIDAGELTLGWERVRLRKAKGSLVGLTTLRWKADTVDVRLSWLTPTFVMVNGVQIDLTGSPVNLSLDAQRWIRDHGAERGVVPMDVRGLRVTWTPREGRHPWFVSEGDTLRRRGDRGDIHFGSIMLGEHAVGMGDLTWQRRPKGTTWTLKPSTGGAVATAFLDNAQRDAVVTLRVVPAKQLASAFGLLWTGTNAATMEGKLEAHFPKGPLASPVTGTARFKIGGYVPSHPPQLNGIMYGRTTEVSTAYSLDRKTRVLTLSKGHVVVGGLRVAGGGEVRLHDEYATLALLLRGHIGCSQLARSAIKEGVRGPLGGLLGQMAGQVLGGKVAVTLQVKGDTRHLEQLRIEPVVGIGCGLKLPQ